MKKQNSPHKHTIMPETTTVVPAICFELTQDIYDTIPDAAKEVFGEFIGLTVSLVGTRPNDR